jgi:hypothetical protein
MAQLAVTLNIHQASGEIIMYLRSITSIFVRGGAVAGIALLSGCASQPTTSMNIGNTGGANAVASEASSSNVARVKFLTDYSRLKVMPDAGGMLCWRADNVNWKQYDKVLIERIQVSIKSGSTQTIDPTDLKVLLDYFHNALVKDITPIAQVVNKAGPGVLRVRLALTQLVPTNATASLVGTAVPYGFVGEIGSGAATGKPAGSTPYLGQTGMEAQFRDGASGAVLAECADTEIGLKYAADLNQGAAKAADAWINGYVDSFTSWTYAQDAFNKWASIFARRLALLQAG